MICPKCGVDSFRVKDSRQHYTEDGELHCIVIRTRECFACGYRQKTPETVEKENTICSIEPISSGHE